MQPSDSISRVVLGRVAALVVLVTLLACAGDATSPEGTVNPATQSAVQTQSSDSVYWVDNVLEFTDDNGDHWRVERDPQEARTATLEKNGSYIGTIDLTWSGSDVTEVRFTEPNGHWADTDTETFRIPIRVPTAADPHAIRLIRIALRWRATIAEMSGMKWRMRPTRRSGSA